MRREHYKKKDPKILLWLDKVLVDKSIYRRVLTPSGNVIENHQNDHIFLNGGTSLGSSPAFIDIGKLEELSTKDFSLSFDVLILSSSGHEYSILFSFGGSNNPYGVLAMRLGNHPDGWYADGERLVTNTLNYNTWYHWEFRRQNGRFEILINNQLEGSTDYGVDLDWGVPAWRIGQNPDSDPSIDEHMTGYMKNIIVKLL